MEDILLEAPRDVHLVVAALKLVPAKIPVLFVLLVPSVFLTVLEGA